MNVVHVSNTALAAAPYEIVKCLNKYTDLKVRWIAHRTHYNDGRMFPSDILWHQEVERNKALNSADIIHIHNELQPMTHELLKGRKVVLQLHSVPVRMKPKAYLQLTRNVYTISQPMQERVYNLPSLPNLIDPQEYTPLPKSNSRPLIVFAPTNSFPPEKLGSKAKNEVIKILSMFADRAEIDVFTNLDYGVNLLRKQNADIIIDDIVGETFHRTTLEASCFGVVVVNNLHNPFWVYADLNNLYHVLASLLNNIEILRDRQRSSRKWILEYWNPEKLCQKYVNVYNNLI